MTKLFPEQSALNDEIAKHIIESLELCGENDPKTLGEWVSKIKEEKTLLKDLIREYLPKKKGQ